MKEFPLLETQYSPGEIEGVDNGREIFGVGKS